MPNSSASQHRQNGCNGKPSLRGHRCDPKVSAVALAFMKPGQMAEIQVEQAHFLAGGWQAPAVQMMREAKIDFVFERDHFPVRFHHGECALGGNQRWNAASSQSVGKTTAIDVTCVAGQPIASQCSGMKERVAIALGMSQLQLGLILRGRGDSSGNADRDETR